MKENQNNLYFKEWWETQARLYAASKGMLLENFDPKCEEIRVTCIRGTRLKPYVSATIEPAPIFMMEWVQSNPHPDLTRDEFIVALAKRVERLGAALAEKGGAR